MRTGQRITSLSDPRPATERRRIAVCDLALQKLSKDERLLSKALGSICVWERRGTCSPDYPRRWRELLALPPAELRAFLLGPSDEAAAMRQNHPFASFFSVDEIRRLTETCRHEEVPARTSN